LAGKCRRKAGYFRVKTGKVQFLQMPAFSPILYSKYLTYYCKCLRCDRSLFTVDGYRVDNCKSQRILRLSSARPSSLTFPRSSDVWNKGKLFLLFDSKLFSVVRGRMTE
jgi:hypothetical protein